MFGTIEEQKPTLGRLTCCEGQWSELVDADFSQEKSIEYRLLYDSVRQCYWQVNAFDQWIRVNEAQAKRSLLCNSKIDKDAIPSTLNHIVTYQDVKFAGPLAGYPVGVYNAGPSTRILVTTAPQFIEPVEGDCETILTLLQEQLGDQQLPYMLGWLKTAVNSVRSHRYMPGQALCLLGPPGTAKTFDQDYIITPLLGGRDAKPYQYMVGQTPFNADLFVGEHLIISDENPHTDLASRVNFGTKIKDICVNHRQKLHAKHREGFMTSPFWRLSISCNDEPENLRILPPIDSSIGDKLILLKVSMPDCLPIEEQREEFEDKIRSELPAFAGYLESFVIPAEIKSNRYGVTHFHHPEVLEALDDLAPETELLNLVDIEIFGGLIEDVWEGTSTELSRRLMGDSSQVRMQARQILRSGQACGRYLKRLAGRSESRVRFRKKDGHTLFIIQSSDQ